MCRHNMKLSNACRRISLHLSAESIEANLGNYFLYSKLWSLLKEIKMFIVEKFANAYRILFASLTFSHSYSPSNPCKHKTIPNFLYKVQSFL